MDDQPRSQSETSDGEALARSVADIAERSQRLVTEFLARQGTDGALGTADPLNVGNAFMEMTAKMMADPNRVMEAQMALWQDYMALWQNTTRRMMGEDAEPVATPDKDDRRFKDAAWSRERHLRLHQAVLPADLALDPVDGRRRRGSGRQNCEKGRFLYPPVRRRPVAHQLRPHQPRGSARDGGKQG